MALTDIQISEELETNAPSIKYSGNEGPKSPQQDRMMMAGPDGYFKILEFMLNELEGQLGRELTDEEYDEVGRKAMEEYQNMSGGQPLPQDPTKPVNPFQPKPQGPVLPDRQMAAYGGIMGLDGRKKYGIGSWFQENIMDPIKKNPLLAAAAAAYGVDTFGVPLPGGSTIGGNKVVNTAISDLYNKPLVQDVLYGKKTNNTENERSGGIIDSLTRNLIPIAGGAMAGLFTKNTESDTPGLPDDNTALQLADLKKSANILNQKQGLAAGMNFLPTVAARRYTPAEMIETYATAANGGRIGFSEGTNLRNRMSALMNKMANGTITPEEMVELRNMESASMFSTAKGMAEGGIMDLGGMEKDYRAEGGFVPIGKEEKADDVPARLSVNEFVFTADAVRNAGGGDIDEGARVMENMMKHLEAGGQVSEESQGMAGARDMFAVSERLSEVV